MAAPPQFEFQNVPLSLLNTLRMGFFCPSFKVIPFGGSITSLELLQELSLEPLCFGPCLCGDRYALGICFFFNYYYYYHCYYYYYYFWLVRIEILRNRYSYCWSPTRIPIEAAAGAAIIVGLWWSFAYGLGFF